MISGKPVTADAWSRTEWYLIARLLTVTLLDPVKNNNDCTLCLFAWIQFESTKWWGGGGEKGPPYYQNTSLTCPFLSNSCNTCLPTAGHRGRRNEDILCGKIEATHQRCFPKPGTSQNIACMLYLLSGNLLLLFLLLFFYPPKRKDRGDPPKVLS